MKNASLQSIGDGGDGYILGTVFGSLYRSCAHVAIGPVEQEWNRARKKRLAMWDGPSVQGQYECTDVGDRGLRSWVVGGDFLLKIVPNKAHLYLEDPPEFTKGCLVLWFRPFNVAPRGDK